MVVIGIDPAFAKSSWLAVLDDDLNIDLIEVRDPYSILETIEPVNPDCIFIEGQYLGKNPDTTIKLVEVRATIVALCKNAGYPVEVVAPSRWQASLPLKTRSRSEVEKWSIMTAKSLFNGQLDPFKLNLNADQAAAIHLAWYGLRKLQKQKVLRQIENAPR